MANKQIKEDPGRNYRLSITDSRSHERLWSVNFNRTQMIVAMVSAIVLLLIAVFCLIAYTPIRTFIPGYPDAHSKRQAVQNVMRIDSLETQILRWELYTENLKRIVAGEEPLRLDSLILSGRRKDALQSEGFYSEQDSLLRAQVQEEEQFQVSGVHRDLPIEAVSFFTPLKGVVSRGYDRAMHPYLDVTAPANSVVMAVLDGTVVFSGWDDDTGYSIAIQHKGDILSIYKHNQKLLKRTGEKVKAGTPVALVGNAGSLTTGDHLHFELWYAGDPVDPTQYISF